MNPWGHETCGARRTGVGKHFYQKVNSETPFSRRRLDFENFHSDSDDVEIRCVLRYADQLTNGKCCPLLVVT